MFKMEQLASLLLKSLLFANVDLVISGIKLYEGYSFTGSLLYEDANIPTKPQSCKTLPDYANDKAHSVLTDSCVLLYSDNDCEGYSIKVLNDGKEPLTDGRLVPAEMDISAYQGCTDQQRDSRLSIVEVRKYKTPYGYEKYHPHGQVVWGNYHNVHSCINLVIPAQRNVGSIWSTYACVRIHFEENCRGSFVDLRAGDSICSIDMVRCGYNSMVSFQPCPSLSVAVTTIKPAVIRPVIKIKAQVYHMEFAATFDISHIGQVAMAAKTTIRNNGSATITKDYSETEKVMKSVQLTRTEAFTKVDSMTTETTNEVGVKLSIETEIGAELEGAFKVSAKIGLETSFKHAFTKANTFTNQHEKSETESVIVEESEQFTVSEKYEIPTCSVYEISSFVKVIKDAPFQYFVLVKYTGTSNDNQLSTSELKRHLGNLDFIGTEDGFSVLVNATGEIRASMGYDSMIHADGHAIQDCHEPLQIGILKMVGVGLVAFFVFALISVVCVYKCVCRKRETCSTNTVGKKDEVEAPMLELFDHPLYKKNNNIS